MGGGWPGGLGGLRLKRRAKPDPIPQEGTVPAGITVLCSFLLFPELPFVRAPSLHQVKGAQLTFFVSLAPLKMTAGQMERTRRVPLVDAPVDDAIAPARGPKSTRKKVGERIWDF